MALLIQCPCGAKLRVGEGAAGQRVTCPKCGTTLRIKGKDEPGGTKRVASGGGSREGGESNRETMPSDRNLVGASQRSDPFSSKGTQDESWSGLQWEQGSRGVPVTHRGKRVRGRGMGWIPIVGVAVILVGVAGVGLAWFVGFGGGGVPVAAPFEPVQGKVEVAGGNVAPQEAMAGMDRGEWRGAGKRIVGSVGPERSEAKSSMMRVAEAFAEKGRQGQSGSALKMMDAKVFEQQMKDGPTPSWEAIMKVLEPEKVLAHLSQKSLEGTPLDSSCRHWRILGETKHLGRPAVLVRYYSDPESANQILTSQASMEGLIQQISVEEFLEAGKRLIYMQRDVRRALTPDNPDSYYFVPPRFGYVMLVFDPNSVAASQAEPQLVDVVNVMGQVPLSQMAGAIYLDSWQVMEIGSGSDTKYSQRVAKANAAGRKAFSLYGTVPKTPDMVLGTEIIPSPALRFRPQASPNPDQDKAFEKSVQDWLAGQPHTRTSRLIQLAHVLQRADGDALRFVEEFRAAYPQDPGADLAVISFAMTSIEPRIPATHYAVIGEAARKLYETYQDPFMLYVQGLVSRARGDEAGAVAMMQRANEAGFVSMGMLRQPLEEAMKAGDKAGVLASLKEIAAYWSRWELEESSDRENQFRQRWNVAKEKLEGKTDNVAQRDPISGGNLGGRRLDAKPGAGPIGGLSGPSGMRPGFTEDRTRGKAGEIPGMGSPSQGAPVPEGIAGRGRVGGVGGGSGLPPGTEQMPGGGQMPGMGQMPGGGKVPGMGQVPGGGQMPLGFGPPQAMELGAGSVRFILRAKGTFDFDAVLMKLRGRLKSESFQMSTSGNESTITLSYAGPFKEAESAVDFGKVVKRDEVNRTLTIEVP